VAVNCAAVPAALIASELFSRERGAFPGALQRRQGKFELADGVLSQNGPEIDDFQARSCWEAWSALATVGWSRTAVAEEDNVGTAHRTEDRATRPVSSRSL
jgi:hypothetical protein